MKVIRIGTRASALAQWQANYVAQLLRELLLDVTIETRLITTHGDRDRHTALTSMGGAGVFTAELERALLDGQIDVAVHSLKDLPTVPVEGLAIAAIPERGSIGDVLVSREGYTLDTLPDGATVGTSSRRRAAQLRHYRHDVQTQDIRGNVDTRITKALAHDSPYDAIVLAQVGLERLGLQRHISQILPIDAMLCAPGQGALAVQCRDEPDIRAQLATIDHHPTRLAVTAERAFLNRLQGGCAVPVAAYGRVEHDRLQVRGRVNDLDGTQQIDVQSTLTLDADTNETDAITLGTTLAQQAIEQGADTILADIQS